MGPRSPLDVGILGGTGALGRGLARRFVDAGLTVRVGSRDRQRADAVVRELLPAGTEAPGSACPATNLQAAGAGVVVIAVPFDALDATLVPLADVLAQRIVVSAVNPLTFDRAGPRPVPVAEGSAAQRVAAVCPSARVTAAFHTVSSVALADGDAPMDDDVPVVGDDPEAVTSVVGLVETIPGCRGVAAGPLRAAAALESLVPVLIEINRRHRRHVGIRFSRL